MKKGEKIMRRRGIEPRSPAWEASILPLNQRRHVLVLTEPIQKWCGLYVFWPYLCRLTSKQNTTYNQSDPCEELVSTMLNNLVSVLNSRQKINQ